MVTDKLENAQILFQKQKYQKALSFIRKVTPKERGNNFTLVQLESACLYHLNKFQQALLKSQQALVLAGKKEEKLSVLQNLALNSEKLLNTQDAIKYLKNILDLDGSLRTAEQRFSLIANAFLIKDYDCIDLYAPFLTNVSEYSLQTLLMLARVNIDRNKQEYAQNALLRLNATILNGTNTNINRQSIRSVINMFHQLQAYDNEKKLLVHLSPVYKYEAWFKDAELRLADAIKIKPISNNKLIDSDQTTNAQPDKKTVPSGSLVDSNAILQTLQKLKLCLEDRGAVFHNDLVFEQQEGEIIVRCKKKMQGGEVLMDVPIHCMPFINDYHFSLDENTKLQVAAKKNMLNPKAKKNMMLLAQLYNERDKFTHWKANYSIFSLAGFKSIFDKLLEARSFSEQYRQYYANDMSKIDNATVIRSFIGSRTMVKTQADLRNLGIKTKSSCEYFFMPFIDLINHKMGAKKFITGLKSKSIQVFADDNEGGDEVFVQYNLDDPLLTFLIYSFIDNSARWIFSVPLRLTTKSGLNIIVDNVTLGADITKLPEYLWGICDLVPTNIERDDFEVKVSKLIIPSKEQFDTLRTVLTYVLKTVDVEGMYVNPKVLEREILHLEKQLINLNQQYWYELKQMVDIQITSHEPLPKLVGDQLLELCSFCLNHIDTYRSQSASVLRL